MRVLYGFFLAAVVCLALNCPAWAGCCLTGVTKYTDYSGLMVLDVGGTTCTFFFQHCDINVYHYAPCEDGPSQVASFRVMSGNAPCQYSVVGTCNTLNSFLTFLTAEGQVDEYYKDC